MAIEKLRSAHRRPTRRRKWKKTSVTTRAMTDAVKKTNGVVTRT
jgi:hypothetical protein